MGYLRFVMKVVVLFWALIIINFWRNEIKYQRKRQELMAMRARYNERYAHIDAINSPPVQQGARYSISYFPASHPANDAAMRELLAQEMRQRG